MFPMIPNNCLPFYRRLAASNSVEDDIESFDIAGEPDFEAQDED